MDEQTLRKLRSKLDKALAANQHEEAIRLLTQLAAADSENARWPHKQGDLLRKLERHRDAASAYAAAADLYAGQGFLTRAVALAKAVANLDPRRLDVLERIDPDAAKHYRRNLRPPTQPLRQSPARADERTTGAGPAREKGVSAAAGGDAVTRPSRAGGAAPERGAPPNAVRERVTTQGFAGGALARAPAASGANNTGAARPTGTANPLPARQTSADAATRAAADIKARTITGRGVGPVVSTIPTASRVTQPLPGVSQRLTLPGRRHPMVLDDDEPVPAPARPVPPPRPSAPPNRARPRVEPPAPPPAALAKPVSNPQPEDDEIIIVVLDEELESESEVTPAVAAAEMKPQPSAADAESVPQPSTAPTPPKRMPLDRLSVPPPRLAPADTTRSAAAASGVERTSPSPLPARAARALELAPPAQLGDADTLDLPTGKGPSLTAATPAHRRPEATSRRPDAGPKQQAEGGANPNSLEAEWSAEPAEEFSRALEAAAPASILPRTAAAVDLASCVDALLRLPSFAKLDAQTLGEIAAGSTLIELGDAASVVHRGKVSDSLYGILSGAATLSGPDRSYELELVEGDLFGEACVLSNEPCQADVCVDGHLHALKIPRANLARLLKRKPRLADQLLGLLTSRLRLAYLATSPLFHELDRDNRQELGSKFEVRRASKGRVLAEQDAPIDGLYVSLTGRLTVDKSGFVSVVAPAFSLFGHQLLMSSKRSPSTITARGNLLLLRLPASMFGEVALRYPRFAARLAKHVSSDVVPLD